MNSLRIEADEATTKVEELQKQLKTLEQENLQKEHEITSLQHKNSGLEAEVEKLENQLKDAKALAEESGQAGTQNETLQRRLQLLEEEAEEADKNLRETNDKYALHLESVEDTQADTMIDFVKPMSRPATLSARFKLSSKTVTSGRQSTRRWPRNMLPYRRNWMTSRPRLVTYKGLTCCCGSMSS